jgi:glycosyltransferase involved in cell wall biosynthesis
MALYSYKLANALVEYGVQVSLLVDDCYELNQAPARFNKVKILSSRNVCGILFQNRLVRIFNILFSHIYNWCKLFSFVRRIPQDIIHIQPQFYLVDWLPLALLKISDRKVVITVHDAVPHGYYTRFTGVEKKILQFVYNKADKLIIHANANRKKLLETYSVEKEKVVVIPHGEYSLRGISSHITEKEARAFLKLEPEHKVALFFGFIRRNKGLDVLLKAFDEVSEKLPNAALVVAGSLIQGATFSPYESIINKMKHRDKVLLFVRYIQHEELPLFFLPADVVVVPYLRFGSQSGVVHLAQGFGKPVIAANAGGLPELVEHNKTGVLVPPGDVGKLADALHLLLRDDRLRMDMGARARITGGEKFSWRDIARATVEKVYMV